jgi:cyclase
VISVDVKNDWRGRKCLYSSQQRKTTSQSWKKFILEAVEAGAGEILMMDVDREGTMSGVDEDLIKTAAELSSVPLVVSGGIGSVSDISMAINCGADAVAIGAFCVFQGPHRAVLITYPEYDELVKATQK